MARGRSRWTSKSLREVFPLPRERQARPRFDGCYVDADAGFALEFDAGAQATFAGQPGSWVIVNGVLRVQTSGWDCEGALDHDSAYLLCSPEGRAKQRLQLRLAFEPSD